MKKWIFLALFFVSNVLPYLFLSYLSYFTERGASVNQQHTFLSIMMYGGLVTFLFSLTLIREKRIWVFLVAILSFLSFLVGWLFRSWSINLSI